MKTVAIYSCVLLATLGCLGNADAYRVMQLPTWRHPRWSTFDWSPSLLSDWSIFPEFESDLFDPWYPWQNQRTMSNRDQTQGGLSQQDEGALLQHTAERLLQRQREVEKMLGTVAKQQAKLEQKRLNLIQEQGQVQHELAEFEQKITKHRASNQCRDSKRSKEQQNKERQEREPAVRPASVSEPGDILALHITGYQPRDLTIASNGNQVIVKGRRSTGCHGDKGSCTVREFERSYTLPHHVTADQLHATYQEGMLRINKHTDRHTYDKQMIPIATDNKLQDEDDGVTVETIE